MDYIDDATGADPAEALSARERLRTGQVDTPSPELRWVRRGAAILVLLGFVGAPLVGYAAYEKGGATSVITGLALLAYLVVMAYLMIRTIRRR